MKLHLIGGFLGSGKTTAIIHAARALMSQGQRVGVVTNDQGRYLVDTAFYRLSALPTVEVTGGCFCCNYDDLTNRLAQLIAEAQPDVIFAESVGSCADVVATVVRPLLEVDHAQVKPASFSVFTDARLLRYHLQGLPMPFSDEVVYIYDKQIEEAGLVVMNKMDLLDGPSLDELARLFSAAYPQKLFLAQSSLSSEGVSNWLNRIQVGSLDPADHLLEIDYNRYSAGEISLAWVDETVEMDFPSPGGRSLLYQVIAGITQDLARHRAGIGHLKFIIDDEASTTKLSIPTLEETGWETRLPEVQGRVWLLINARVQIPVDTLSELIRSAITATGVPYTIRSREAFHPRPPNPTHRIS